MIRRSSTGGRVFVKQRFIRVQGFRNSCTLYAYSNVEDFMRLPRGLIRCFQHVTLVNLNCNFVGQNGV